MQAVTISRYGVTDRKPMEAVQVKINFKLPSCVPENARMEPIKRGSRGDEMRHRHIWILIMFAGVCTSAQDQWLDHPAPEIPRTRDGKVNLSAAAPRTSDGRPDLSGVWQTNGSPPDASLSLQPNNTV